MIETSIDRLQGDDFCTVFTAERKFINRLKELAQGYPNEVIIKYINEDGSIEAKVPFGWFRFVKPPSKRKYTKEQKEAMRERMKKARKNKNVFI